MESLAKRIAYLQGLTDGLEVGENSKEGRIISEMVTLLDELHVELKTLQLRMEEAESYVEAVDCDLGNLEWFVYDDEDLYEDVDDDDFVIEGRDQDYYDLDDSEDSYIYAQNMRQAPAINPS
ncbi:CD1247 N-terminal domain-containing protein [Brevibacillus fluminis]|uniref:CD1247 N-terminal domain-containing protein n=1 Tax=Brevibacillus fluminis TaxID=511487 RepID=UPI003F8BFFEB